MKTIPRFLMILVFGALLVGCSDDGSRSADGGSSSSSSSSSSSTGGLQDIELQPEYSSIQADLFSTTCAVSGCHRGGSPPQGLNLEADQSYGMLVDVPSTQDPSLDRVEPGDPDNSYLIRKLEGEDLLGERMPRNGPPYLTQEQIDVIRQWISDGATDDRGMATIAAVTAPARVVAVNPQPDAVLEQAPAWVTVAVDRPLDSSLVNRRTVRVVASGGDGGFTEGNETAVRPASVEVSGDNRGLIKVDLRGTAMDVDRYRIELTDNNGIAVATIDGTPVDGDNDGVAGGAFVSEFTVN